MRFGPFDGEICRGGDQYNYTDAERDTHSNWMRYVVCSDEEEVQALSCPYCQSSFPAAVYLHRHVRRSHPEEYTHLSVAQAFEPVEQTPVTNLDQCLLTSDTPSSSQCYLHKHIHCHHPEMTTKHLCFNEGDMTSKDHSCTQCSKIFRTIRGFKNHACFRQGDQLYLS
ncbi:hypothetical protein AOLI_G00091900 [Acnodon oligacanthus]